MTKFSGLLKRESIFFLSLYIHVSAWNKQFFFLFGRQDECHTKQSFFSKIMKMFFFKASVRYFLSKFYFSPNDSPLKTTKNVISSKKLFSFSRHSSFSIFVFPSFCPCQPLLQRLIQDWYKVDTNLIVYDVINCLNKNIITHFVWYLEKEIRCDIETLSIDRVLNKEHFYRKIMQKMCTKS